MVRTSTAEKHGYRCPVCGDELSEDKVGRGFVRHKYLPGCLFEKGEYDTYEPHVSVQANGVEILSNKPPGGRTR